MINLLKVPPFSRARLHRIIVRKIKTKVNGCQSFSSRDKISVCFIRTKVCDFCDVSTRFVHPAGKSKTFIEFVSLFSRSACPSQSDRDLLFCAFSYDSILFYSFFSFLSPSFNSVCTQKTVLKRSTLPNLRIKIVQFWI